jgi:hypothetical protein
MIEVDKTGPGKPEIRRRHGAAGLSIIGFQVAHAAADERRMFVFEVPEFRALSELRMLDLVNEVGFESGVIAYKWGRNSDAA